MRLYLFLTTCLLTGLGGAVGSMLGNAFGKTSLWVGGVVGGLVMAYVVARLAVWRRWIDAAQWPLTAVGAAVGFLIAAAVAVRTLSSPIGPILSTTISGIGALVGSSASRKRAR